MSTSPSVGIIGAGTMGAGIAQVAAAGGWHVVLMDVDADVVRRAIGSIGARLDRLVEKGRLEAGARDTAAARLTAGADPESMAECALVIEAVVEDLDVKVAALGPLLPVIGKGAIIATNTSSLSVTSLGAAIDEPRRTVGMHFFNPAPLLKLVEVIAGAESDPGVVDRVAAIATAWGKRVARAADVPGFIVNHVARPYYLEAFRILEDGGAAPDVIDAACKRLGGFRMGPLELTDLIGQDINLATTRSVWEQIDRPPLLRPCRVQEALVAAGHLGRKTGRGVYRYDDEGGMTPALEIAPAEAAAPAALASAVDSFMAGATDETGTATERYVLARILVSIIAQAVLARERGVAEREDIDIALRYGTNYPRGPFEWAERIGWGACAALLEALNETVDDDRFAVPGSMRSLA